MLNGETLELFKLPSCLTKGGKQGGRRLHITNTTHLNSHPPHSTHCTLLLGYCTPRISSPVCPPRVCTSKGARVASMGGTTRAGRLPLSCYSLPPLLTLHFISLLVLILLWNDSAGSVSPSLSEDSTSAYPPLGLPGTLTCTSPPPVAIFTLSLHGCVDMFAPRRYT